jgi:hypothetical protein
MVCTTVCARTPSLKVHFKPHQYEVSREPDKRPNYGVQLSVDAPSKGPSRPKAALRAARS